MAKTKTKTLAAYSVSAADPIFVEAAAVKAGSDFEWKVGKKSFEAKRVHAGEFGAVLLPVTELFSVEVKNVVNGVAETTDGDVVILHPSLAYLLDGAEVFPHASAHATSTVVDDGEDEDEEEAPAPKRKAPAAKKPAAKKRVTEDDWGDDDDDGEDEDEEEAPAPKRKAPAAKKPAAKKRVTEDDWGDDDDDGEDEDEEEAPAPKRKAPAAKKPAVVEDDDDDWGE